MNQIIEAMEARRSVRKFTDVPVAKEDLEQIVEAGLFAASGMGQQAVKMIVVQDEGLRNQLSRMNASIMGGKEGTDPFYGAGTVIVVLADKSRPTYVYDGGLVMGNLMLAADALGLGSCWIHRAKEEFESAEGKEILHSLGIEGDWEGIGHCILGHMDGEKPVAAPRKENRVIWK